MQWAEIIKRLFWKLFKKRGKKKRRKWKKKRKIKRKRIRGMGAKTGNRKQKIDFVIRF